MKSCNVDFASPSRRSLLSMVRRKFVREIERLESLKRGDLEVTASIAQKLLFDRKFRDSCEQENLYRIARFVVRSSLVWTALAHDCC
jgi:hypothetical protein